ncbi:TRAP transporter large permease [Limnochorda pilosa]|uniref:C4-dicarboxylate ABC transporter permease n=1 Tax=Limnochorda pilosa TaxID=1555112 RepID=A0A0K2SLE0_LIMPI|nr:TRAP transporter large permease [Limnochorda pilosa]BAS27920.1 C4-dicarboxylate ABC transporter permease [Limnochorda pilosa]
MALAVLLTTFLVLLAVRIPIAFALGLTSLAYVVLFVPGISLTVLTQQMFAGADSFTLTAIPFFVLAGELMNAGGVARRLVQFSKTLVGHFTGGVGVVALFSSMIFASFSGSAVANAVGTGTVTIPAMIRTGYTRGLAAAVESSSSSLGAIIPPSIPMVVYGALAGVSIGGLFVAGYVPGIIFGLGLALIIRLRAKQLGIPVEKRASRRELLASLKESALALLTPIIIMGGILGGVMTPTEAGAVGALYTLFVAVVIYRELALRDLPRVLVNTAATTGVVMLVMTIASVFSWIMAYEMIPATLAQSLLATIGRPWLLMIVLVLVMLAIGTFIDTLSAIIILTPVIIPIASTAGVDPLFLGLIITTALTFGVLTPPVGTVLFVTSSIAGTTIEETAKAVLPFVAILVGGTLLLAVSPQVALWLPRLLGF